MSRCIDCGRWVDSTEFVRNEEVNGSVSSVPQSKSYIGYSLFAFRLDLVILMISILAEC